MPVWVNTSGTSTGVYITRPKTPGSQHGSGGFSRAQEEKLTAAAIQAPEGIDSLITANEAAGLCGVAASTIRRWQLEGRIERQGIDRHGRNMYRILDIAKAERATRKNARR